LHVLRFERLRRFGATAVVASFELVISHRLMTLAADSGTSLLISRASIPALRISIVSPVPSPPRPLSADEDTPSKHCEHFRAAHVMLRIAMPLSGMAEAGNNNQPTCKVRHRFLLDLFFEGDILGCKSTPISSLDSIRTTACSAYCYIWSLLYGGRADRDICHEHANCQDSLWIK
jgi:hypothetical protein